MEAAAVAVGEEKEEAGVGAMEVVEAIEVKVIDSTFPGRKIICSAIG